MKPVPRVSLRSLAAQLGLSHNTVALALRGDPRVNAATAARVSAHARKAGYRGDPLLSRAFSELRKRRHSLSREEIFFVNCSPWRKPEDNPTARGYLAGCKARAAELGFSLSTWSMHPESAIKWSQLVRIGKSRGVRGWILWGIAFAPVKLELPADVAFIALNYALSALPINRVMTQHFSVVTIALAALQARGRRRIGFVLPRDIDHSLNQQWTAAYLSHLPAAERLELFPLDSTEQLAANGPRLKLWLRRNRPDAVLSWHHDLPAWLRANGYRVPEDCAVADIDLPRDSAAGGIDQLNEKIGGLAVDQLSSLIAGRSFGAQEVSHTLQLRPHWREGDTTGSLSRSSKF